MLAIILLCAFLLTAAVAAVGATPDERTLMEPDAGGAEGSAGQICQTHGGSKPHGGNRCTGQEVGLTASGSESVRYLGLTAAQWARRYRHMRHLAYTRRIHARQLQRTLLHRPNVTEALELAATVYGHRAELWRKARCESNLDPNARNGSEASGLLQFLPSTWRSTPFARFDVFSPYANALAGGWMHSHGRGGEWSCR